MYRVLCGLALSTALLVTDVHAAQGAAADFAGPGGLNDGSPHRRPQLITGWVGLPYVYYGWGYKGFPFSVGASFLQPLVNEGFVPQLNDSFHLEVGVNLAFGNSGGWTSVLSIPVEVAWALHLTPNLAGYLKLGAAINFAFGYYPANNNGAWLSAFPIAALGIWYRLTNNLYLRVQAGWPALYIGLGFGL